MMWLTGTVHWTTTPKDVYEPVDVQTESMGLTCHGTCGGEGCFIEEEDHNVIREDRPH